MTAKQLTVLVALAAGAAFLTACGQKGPLFLPGSPSTITTPAPEPQPAPEEEAEEERKQPTDDPA